MATAEYHFYNYEGEIVLRNMDETNNDEDDEEDRQQNSDDEWSSLVLLNHAAQAPLSLSLSCSYSFRLEINTHGEWSRFFTFERDWTKAKEKQCNRSSERLKRDT